MKPGSENPDSTRGRIIRSAIEIARNQGITRVTIQSVANAAKVSKGGLLYHFPSKDDLVLGMLVDSIDAFFIRLQELADEDGKPGKWLRAFVAATFPGGGGASDVGPAILAALLTTDQPIATTLRETYQAATSKWSELILSDGVDPQVATLIVMAADGLFLNEALGVRPLSPQYRREFLKRLVSLSRMDEPSTPALTG